MDTIMQELQPYFVAIVLAIVAGISTVVAVAVKAITKKAVVWIESKTTESQQVMLKEVGKEAFAMAETTFNKLGGQDKLTKATQYASKKLEGVGINVPATEIQASVNAAWVDNKAVAGTSTPPKKEVKP